MSPKPELFALLAKSRSFDYASARRNRSGGKAETADAPLRMTRINKEYAFGTAEVVRCCRDSLAAGTPPGQPARGRRYGNSISSFRSLQLEFAAARI